MFCAAQVIYLTVITLFGLGLVMIHSAAMRVDDVQSLSLLSLLVNRRTLYAVLAVLAMVVVSRFDVRHFERLTGRRNPLWWLLGLALLLVILAMVPVLGRSVHGARRWLYLGPQAWGVSFQPSELLKWVLVLVMAWWCGHRMRVIGQFRRGLAPALLVLTVACGLVVIEDLGTGVLMAVVASLLLIAGGARLWQMAMTIPIAGLPLTWLIMDSPYRLARITAFANPWEDAQGIGYHPIQSMLAISGGGVGGRGLGNGIQKFGYLPEDTTDFLFAVICEELGIGGGVLVVALLLALLWAIFMVAHDCKDTFTRLVALGVALTIGLQAVINIAVVTVMVPTKGIALPLLSAGGTGWVLTAVSLGLVASLDRANRLERSRGFEVEAHPDTGTLELGT